MSQSDRTRSGASRSGQETVSETGCSVSPGHARLLVAGGWVDRESDWRDDIDLGDAAPHEIYAAGLRDGYEIAISELKEFAALLADRLSIERSSELAERRMPRRLV